MYVMCIYSVTVDRTSCAQVHDCHKTIVVITGKTHCFYDCICNYT